MGKGTGLSSVRPLDAEQAGRLRQHKRRKKVGELVRRVFKKLMAQPMQNAIQRGKGSGEAKLITYVNSMLLSGAWTQGKAQPPGRGEGKGGKEGSLITLIGTDALKKGFRSREVGIRGHASGPLGGGRQ